MKTEVLFSNNSDDWETPEDLYEKLDAEFHFTLDPCSSEKNHKCQQYYTKAQDGLIPSRGGIQCSAIRHIPGYPTGLRRDMRNRLSHTR